MTTPVSTSASTPVTTVGTVVIRFAGDSGDGMQLTGDRFTAETASLGNDLATLPNFPAEIRSPAGTLAGVSSFQVQFADHDVLTPGDAPDVLVAMNPAALKANLPDLPHGGTVVVDSDSFSKRNLARVGYAASPLEDGSLSSYAVHAVPLTSMTVTALSELGLGRKDAERSTNMFALGLLSWLYSRPTDGTRRFLETKFARKPEILAANIRALEAGWSFGETTETFAVRYEVAPAPAKAGLYRNVTGNTALALGLATAAHKAGLNLVLGSYPITPASDILHTLSGLKRFGVTTLQAEDEISGVGAALGASYGGALGVTTTSGPGLSLKGEMLGLAVSLELPLILVDVQRGGPSTGLPTKTEQSDLLQAMFGRHGEAPLPIVAADTPAGCFDAALEAVRIATTYMTPVILLSDGYLANGSEPWHIPDVATLPAGRTRFARPEDVPEGEAFRPFSRNPGTLARPWALPGTPGLEHRIGGLEKADGTGEISYDPDNHDRMVRLRQAKIDGVDVPELDVDDPWADGSRGAAEADVLVLGWGSTFGPISAAVRKARQQGMRVAQAHLRHMNPFPANTGDVLRSYPRVLVPEMNLGQLSLLLRARYLVDVTSHTAVRGQPFSSDELLQAVTDVIAHQPPRSNSRRHQEAGV